VLLFDAACPMIDGRLKKWCLGWMSERQDVERFTEGTELMGAAEVQLQSDLTR